MVSTLYRRTVLIRVQTAGFYFVKAPLSGGNFPVQTHQEILIIQTAELNSF